MAKRMHVIPERPVLNLARLERWLSRTDALMQELALVSDAAIDAGDPALWGSFRAEARRMRRLSAAMRRQVSQ